ncbi:gag-pol polyprotein precursor [Lasius niger]|uniref:Gag-pol polyprotein n=1 Tax=Lasius niger TaxID=67767 RepID=A0A0J7KR36_LASNI|nr:gag-pol polyprotein precursor [Lasius niger]
MTGAREEAGSVLQLSQIEAHSLELSVRITVPSLSGQTSLLHLSETFSASNPDPPDHSDSSATTGNELSTSSVASNIAALAVSSGALVLLSTALVTCSNNQGSTLVARALLDSGSEASFLSERFAQMLRLPKRRVHVPVAGIQGTSSGVVAHSVALTIGSPRDPGVRLHVPSVLVLPKLTSVFPSRRVQRCDGLIWPD